MTPSGSKVSHRTVDLSIKSLAVFPSFYWESSHLLDLIIVGKGVEATMRLIGLPHPQVCGSGAGRRDGEQNGSVRLEPSPVSLKESGSAQRR